MGIDITLWKDIASSNKLFIAAGIILILIVFILMVRLGLKRMKDKSGDETVFNPKNEQTNELFGIDIKPDEFKSEILEMKADFLASASLTTSVKQEAIKAPEPFVTHQPTVTSGSMTAQEPTTSQELIPELDGYEFEDELEYESPEEAASSPESEIPSPDTEEEMLEEEIDFPFETEVSPQEEENTSEKTILPPGLDVMEKKDEVKPAEVLSAAPEQSMAQPEPEIKLFNFETYKEAKSQTEQDLAPIEKEEEKAAEDADAAEPEIKLFNFEAGMAAKHKKVAASPEKITSERKDTKSSERKSLF